MIKSRIIFSVLALFVFAAPLLAGAVDPPLKERGDLDVIQDWLAYDFLNCADGVPYFEAETCFVAAISKCQDDYFYRYCNNQARTLGSYWIRQEMLSAGLGEGLVEEWFEATDAFCSLLYHVWITQPDAPPTGLALDNSTGICFNERMFDVLGYVQ